VVCAGWLTSSCTLNGLHNGAAAEARTRIDVRPGSMQYQQKLCNVCNYATARGLAAQLKVATGHMQAAEPASDWKQALKGGVAYTMPVPSQQPGAQPWGSTAQGAVLSAEQQLRLRRRHIVFRDLYDRGWAHRAACHADAYALSHGVHCCMAFSTDGSRLTNDCCNYCRFHVTSGHKFGGDFLCYQGDPHLFHAQYTVRVQVSWCTL
jgi:tRNA intron endonuclease, catalytic C-terminal domain